MHKLRVGCAVAVLCGAVLAGIGGGVAQAPAPQAPVESVDPDNGFAAAHGTAMTALKARARAGDNGAAQVLSDYLLGIERTEAEHAEGLAFLRQAAAGGILAAGLDLADILARGRFGSPVDVQGAVALYEAAIARGDNSARRELANLLLEGKTLPAAPLKAIELLQQAVNDGDVSAATQLAAVYAKGRGVAVDGQKAVALYQIGVVAGDSTALAELGELYRTGVAGVPPDPELAAVLLEAADRAGDSDSRKERADMLVRGEAGAADFAAGLSLLEPLAAAGDVSADVQIGDYYAEGEVVPIDAQEAVQHYRRAAATGHVGALVKLGDLYRDGLGTLAKDASLALGFYERAAALGDNAARRNLAQLLVAGAGLPRDSVRAVNYLEQAVADGDANAALTLAELLRRGGVVPLDGRRAVALLDPLVAADNGAAIKALAELYAEGAGAVRPDPARAATLYQRAAARGDNGARKRLADMRLSGEGVPADPAAAIQLLEAAAEDGDTGAMNRLGALFSEGGQVPPDAVTAVGYYAAAAAAGDSGAAVKAADLYANGGAGLRSDPVKAMALYEAAVAKGHNGARRRLADLLLDQGGDPARAVTLLTASAAEGDANAAETLGSLYAAGRVGMPADYAKAKQFFERAEALGSGGAKVKFGVALTEGPLATTHALEGIGALKQAVNEKLPGAAVALARLQIAGKVPGDAAPQALAVLNGAAAAGDVAAVRYLLQLYREGARNALPPDAAKAEALLATHSQLLGPAVTAAERIYLAAAGPATPASFERIAAELETMTLGDSERMLQRLRRLNHNAYVYVVQRRLAALELYRGPLNGVLTGATIDAIRAACDRAGEKAVCDTGPLTAEAASVLANFLWAD